MLKMVNKNFLSKRFKISSQKLKKNQENVYCTNIWSMDNIFGVILENKFW
jgi:hypothetical protein